MVATLGKVSSAKESADYYIHSQASHRPAEEYYTAGEEPDGLWYNPYGMFGLKDGDKVLADAFYTLHSGFHPRNPPLDFRPRHSQKLTQNAGLDKRTAAFDLTFSADKTVSAVWAMARPELRAEIAKAHEDAVRSALDLIVKEHCSWTRIRPDSNADHQVIPAKLMAATFQHHSSRANDPQLHTHTVIFNFTQAEDGKFRSLHAQPLYAWMRTAGSVYRNALAYNLRQLGFDTERHGRKEEMIRIKGDLDEIVRVWSKRRRMIVAAARQLGLTTADNPGLAERINKRTRDAKEQGVDPLARDLRWDIESSTVYEDPDGFIESLRTYIAVEQGDPIVEEMVRELRAIPEKLTEQEAVWKITDVMQEVALVTAGVVQPKSIAAVTERVLEYTDVVELDRWGDGPNVQADLAHTRVFSTPAQLERERNIQRLAGALDLQPTAAIPDAMIDAQLAELDAAGYPLSDEQIAAIRRACGPQRNLIVEGAAGSGKTTTLVPVAELARKAGWNVYGTANSWLTSKALQTECRIPAWCMKTVLNRYRRGTLNFDDRSLIIVDEAGQLSVRQTEALLKIAQETGCRILWAGDTGQQQPIEAGPGLRLMRDVIGSVEVKTIRRQRADAEDILVQVHGLDIAEARDRLASMTTAEKRQIVEDYRALENPPEVKPWQIEASEALRDKDPARAIAAYHARGRIHLADDLDDTLRTLVDDWEQHREEAPDESSLVIARTHAELGALTPVLRERTLSPEQLEREVPLIVAGDNTEKRHAQPKSLLIAPGDRLVVRVRVQDLDFQNGTILTVTDIATTHDENGRPRLRISARTDDGRDVSFDPDQMRDWDPQRGLHGRPRLDYGYALTFSAAQGATVDRAFVLADDRPAIETIYPALTRHRDRLDIYCNTAPIRLTIADDRPESEDANDGDVTDEEVLQRLAKTWKRSDPKRAALDHILDPETRKHGYRVPEDADEEEIKAKGSHANLVRPAPPDSLSAVQWLRANRTDEAPSPFVDEIIRSVRADQTARNHTRDLTELAARIEAVSESYRKLTEEAKSSGDTKEIWRSPEYMKAVREHYSLVPAARRALARFTRLPGFVSNAARAGLTREVLLELIRDYDRRRHALRSAKSSWDPAEQKSFAIVQAQWNDILHVAGERNMLPIHVPGSQQALTDMSRAVADRTIPETRLPTFTAILEEQRRAHRLDRQVQQTLNLIPPVTAHLNKLHAARNDPLDRSIDWAGLEQPVTALEAAVGALPPPAEIDPYLRRYHLDAEDLLQTAVETARRNFDITRARYKEELTAAGAELAALFTSAGTQQETIEAGYPDFTQPAFDKFEQTVNKLAEAADKMPRSHDATRMLRENHQLMIDDIYRALPKMNGTLQTMDRVMNPLGQRATRSPADAYIPKAKERSMRRQTEEQTASKGAADQSRKQSPSQKQDRGITL